MAFSLEGRKGHGVDCTAAACRCCHCAQGQARLEQVQRTGGSRVGRRMGTDSSQGESACFRKWHYEAVMGTSYSVHSPPPERERHTVRLRDGSTQHVHGKQFIFLPRLLTGGEK